MLSTLADLQPIIVVPLIVLLLAGLHAVELGWAHFAPPADRARHDGQNLMLCLLSFGVNGVLCLVVVASASYADTHRIGLRHSANLPLWASIPAGMLLYNLGSYAFHNLQHHVPALWRLHRVHHADTSPNTTSSLRFHPIGVAITQGLFPIVWIPLIGMSMASFIVYGTLAIVLLIPQHANVRFPQRRG